MENFNNNTFKKDGDVLEYFVLKKLKVDYPNARNDNVDGVALEDWDLYIPEKDCGIEIKGDFRSLETGNIVIETANKGGRLSALSVTKAKYWVIITGKRYIWITPLAIYRFIDQHKKDWFWRDDLKGEGDNYTKTAYMFKHDKFVLYVRGLDKEDGWVEMIKENDPLHINNFYTFTCKSNICF